MSRKRKKFISDDAPSEDMALQITSMADIFTIILVFLLKSFATGMTTITPQKGMHLPSVTANAKGNLKEALKLEITSNSILVDQKPVLALNDFQPPADALPQSEEGALENAAPQVLEPVLKALQAERAKSQERSPSSTAADGESNKSDGNLIVLADEQTPYSTLKSVMASAANAGYTDLQLIVLGAE